VRGPLPNRLTTADSAERRSAPPPLTLPSPLERGEGSGPRHPIAALSAAAVSFTASCTAGETSGMT
jgi:hypothetical protein